MNSDITMQAVFFFCHTQFWTLKETADIAKILQHFYQTTSLNIQVNCNHLILLFTAAKVTLEEIKRKIYATQIVINVCK